MSLDVSEQVLSPHEDATPSVPWLYPQVISEQHKWLIHTNRSFKDHQRWPTKRQQQIGLITHNHHLINIQKIACLFRQPDDDVSFHKHFVWGCVCVSRVCEQLRAFAKWIHVHVDVLSFTLQLFKLLFSAQLFSLTSKQAVEGEKAISLLFVTFLFQHSTSVYVRAIFSFFLFLFYFF